MPPRETLPCEIETLKDLVLETYQRLEQEQLRAEQEKKRAEQEKQRAEQEKQRAEYEHRRAELFKYDLECLKRRFFGASSEKRRDAEGQKLLFDLPQPEPPQKPESAAPAEPARRRRNGGGRRKLPPELSRHRIEHALPENQRICPCCNEVMQPIGEETSEQVEYYPEALFAVENVRIKYACTKNKCAEKPVAAPAPDKVVDKGLAGPGLLASNVVFKFLDHQPNYRQESIFARYGLEIPRSTQCDWQAQVADLLAPLYERMAAEVLRSYKLHTDDTPIRVLDPGRGKTREGRIWVYWGDDKHPFVVFDYTPNRCRDGPARFLKDFAGYLQADAYVGYDRIYAGEQVLEVACWAHARRKFYDAVDSDARGLEMLDLIAKLYAVEALARPAIEQARLLPAGQREPVLEAAYAARLRLRQEQSIPLLAQIKSWLEARAEDTLPKSPLGQARTYALNQWTALERFTTDGRLEIDNNIAENALRPVALGRKNYLFVGNDNGGRRAAILYSLIRTCQRHNVEPWNYLRDVLLRISTHPASRIDELLPHLWKPATVPLRPPR